MAEKCDACNGRLEEDFISDYASMAVDQRPCGKCRGDGVLRTGPYHLADGTWSDGVDRQLPLSDRPITAGRYEVTRSDWGYGGWIVFFRPHEEMLGFHQRGFDTHAEAIAYADKHARTTKNGGAS